jgi:peptidoglycan hydrolase-like protein with peptidoglycan-binding domain
MMLKSKLLSPSQRLNACEVQDSAHVLLGDAGDHVRRIQQALIRIDNLQIAPAELASATYGKSTADAVLDYKRHRNIINRSYEKTADNIVGKMTIRSLDDEMLKRETGMSDDFFGAGLRNLLGRLT